jgi:hypothetical protein
MSSDVSFLCFSLCVIDIAGEKSILVFAAGHGLAQSIFSDNVPRPGYVSTRSDRDSPGLRLGNAWR